MSRGRIQCGLHCVELLIHAILQYRIGDGVIDGMFSYGKCTEWPQTLFFDSDGDPPRTLLFDRDGGHATHIPGSRKYIRPEIYGNIKGYIGIYKDIKGYIRIYRDIRGRAPYIFLASWYTQDPRILRIT